METMTNYYLEEFYGRYYSVAQYRGVSFRIVGREITQEIEYLVICDEEDCEHLEEYCYEESVKETFTGRLIGVMIGDDLEYAIDPEDLTEIEEEDFCAGCGQIGCGH